MHGQALQRLGRGEEAVRAFTHACEMSPSYAKPWALLSEACAAVGRRDEALAAIDRAIELAPDVDSCILSKAELVIAAGDTGRADALLQQFILRSADHADASRQVFRLYQSLGRGDDAIAVLNRARAHSPEDAGMRLQFAEDLLAADRPQDALDMIEGAQNLCSDDATKFRLGVLAGRACDVLGLEDQAIRNFSHAAVFQPDNLEVLQRLTFHDQEQGHWPQTRPLMLQLQKVRAAALPPTLAEGLHDIWDNVRKTRPISPAMAWAWEYADQGVWDWNEWRMAAAWGAQASALLKDWWRWAPERTDEIHALIDAPDLTPIRESMAGGRGCILAGAHVGASAIAVEIFRETGVAVTRVGFAGHERALEDEQGQVITVTANRLATTRAIIDQLSAGHSIGWTLDSPIGAGASFDFMGRSVQLIAIAPRLARRHASASFWCQPLWRGDRIVVEIERLPDPVDGEPEADWTARWYGAYLRRLEAVVRGDPRNLVLRRGLWYEPKLSELYGAPRSLLQHAISTPVQGSRRAD